MDAFALFQRQLKQYFSSKRNGAALAQRFIRTTALKYSNVITKNDVDRDELLKNRLLEVTGLKGVTKLSKILKDQKSDGSGRPDVAFGLYYLAMVDDDFGMIVPDIELALFGGTKKYPKTFENVIGTPPEKVRMHSQNDLRPPSKINPVGGTGIDETTRFIPLFLNHEPFSEPGWLSPFNEATMRFVGREEELRLLEKFLTTGALLSIWSIVGPSGAGKTRLAHEWLLRTADKTDWTCGFAESINSKTLRNWRPQNHTVIVIDDLFETRSTLKFIVDRCIELRSLGILRFKIRIVVIDRQFPETLTQAVGNIVWGEVFKRSSDLASKAELLHSHSPLSLDDDLQSDKFISSIIYQACSDPVRSKSRVSRILKKIKKVPGAKRPLFAALIAKSFNEEDQGHLSDIRQLTYHHLAGADHIPWLNDGIDGDLIGMLISVATFLEGVSKEEALKSILPSSVKEHPKRLNQLLAQLERILSEKIDNTIPPIIPDFFGDLFLLSYVDQIKSSPQHFAKLAEFLCRNEEEQAEELVIGKFLGIAESLTSQAAAGPGIHQDWANLLDLMIEMKSNSGSQYRYGLTFFKLFEIAYNSGDFEYVQVFNDRVGIVRIEKFPEESSDAPELLTAILRYLDQFFEVVEYDEEIRDWLFGSVHSFQKHFVEAPDPLYVCALNNFIFTAEGLLNSGAKFDEIFEEDGMSALHVAAHEGNAEFVELLLSRDANPNVLASLGEPSPLLIAAESGHDEICQQLFEAGAEISYVGHGDLPTALHAAAYNGHASTVSWLLKNGVEPDIACHQGWYSPLARACLENKLSAAKLLIDAGANLDLVIDNDTPLLTHCIINANIEIVELLLENGATINYPFERGLFQPLDAAATSGKTEIVRILLERGAEVNFIREADDINAMYTPLSAALRTGTLESARLLLDAGADPNFGHEDGIPTALESCVAKGDPAFLEQLITRGATVNAKSAFDVTALMSAATWGSSDIVETLLKAGADPNISRWAGQTPLILAAERGSVDICAKLMSAGADTSHLIELTKEIDKSVAGSALNYAARGGSIATYELLLDADPMLFDMTLTVENPLISAAENGQTEFVEYCIEKGADPDMLSLQSSETALTWAAIYGHHKTCEKLIELGADPDKVSTEGDSALMWACQMNNSEVVKTLLMAGANPNYKRPNGDSAIHVAASFGSVECIKLLVEYRADLNAKGNNYNTAVMCAACGDHIAAIKLLFESGTDLDKKNRSGFTATDLARLNFSNHAAAELLKLGGPGFSFRMHLRRIIAAAISMPLHFLSPRIFRDRFSDKLLHRAQYGYVEQVEELLELADIDHQDPEGNTALHFAAFDNNMDLARLLICKGANPEIECDEKLTPIKIARENEFDALLELLVKNVKIHS